jgi:hypothetical protein
MQDLIITGIAAGLAGGTVGVIFSHSLYLAGVTSLSSIHLAAALVLMEINNLTAAGLILSLATHLLVASAYGVALTLLLHYTGKDHYIIKGLSSGAVSCLVLHSYLLPMVRSDLNLIPNAAAGLTMLITHSFIGLVAAIVIVKYAKLHSVPE